MKKNARFIGLGGCLVMLLSLFLPFVKLDALFVQLSVNYIQGDGKIALVLIIAAAVLLFVQRAKIALVPTALALAMAVYSVASLYAAGYSSVISFGLGLFLYILGGIVVIVSCVLCIKNPE